MAAHANRSAVYQPGISLFLPILHLESNILHDVTADFRQTNLGLSAHLRAPLLYPPLPYALDTRRVTLTTF